MFQEELCRHPDIRHVEYSPHTYFETHHWLKGAVLLQRPKQLFSGGEVYLGYGTRENARAYINETLTGNIPDYIVPQGDRAIVFDGWEALCGKYATPVFFEKSPQVLANWAAVSLMLEWKKQTGFNVKIIGLVRNPLAVQYSAKELFSTDAEVRQYGWLEIQRNLLALKSLVSEEEFKLLRYEDILMNPTGSFRDVCDFIGLDPAPTLGASVHGNSREKWREDASYTLQLDESVIQIARAFGYENGELENPHKPTPESLRLAAPSLGRRTQLLKARIRDRLVRPAYLQLRSRFVRR